MQCFPNFSLTSFIILLCTACSYTTAKAPIQTVISALSLDGDIPDIRLMSDGKIESLNIYTKTRSRHVKYIGPRHLKLFRKLEVLNASGSPVRKPLGEVTLHGEHTRYLLLFSKTLQADEEYSILAIPDSYSEFKAGIYRFINLAPYPIALMIGDTKHLLAQFKTTDVAGQFEHGNYYQSALVSLREGRENPQAIFSGRIYFNQYMRTLFILAPDANSETGQVNVVSIPERVRN